MHSKKILIHVQDRLFTLGAILATDPEKATLKSGKERLNIPRISEEDISLLETEMDNINEKCYSYHIFNNTLRFE